MAKSPESSEAGRAVRARGRPSRTTPLAHLTGPSRSRARAAVSWAARSISSRSSRSRPGPASPHSPLEHPTPAGITFVARAPRPSSASHPALEHLGPRRHHIRRPTSRRAPETKTRTRVLQRPHSCFWKTPYASMPQGRASRGIRLCDPAPAPHPSSRARQPHATRCARRAE